MGSFATRGSRHDGSSERFPILIEDSDSRELASSKTARPFVPTSSVNHPTRPLGSRLVFVAEGISCFITAPVSSAPPEDSKPVTPETDGSSPGFLTVQGCYPRASTPKVTHTNALPAHAFSPDSRESEPTKPASRTPVEDIGTGRSSRIIPAAPTSSTSDKSFRPEQAQGTSSGVQAGDHVPSGGCSCEPRQSRAETKAPLRQRVAQSTQGATMDRAPIASRPQPEQWDFNGSDSLPGSVPTSPRCPQVPEFARCNDQDLLSYLSKRRVSTGFLHEIDQFLHRHVHQIRRYVPDFVALISSVPPLEAYRYFIKGWTRPARYVDGVILTSLSALPAGFAPMSLRDRHDPELDDFFAGFDYRYDILDRIDSEVRYTCENIRQGMSFRISPSRCRLVCYAIYGNPVDAYKYYEYNYQQDYMPHRCLPEHVVLGDIPKPAGYSEPEPSRLHGWNRHRHVRDQMARAKDQGVDVVDVLLKEYRITLVKKRLRRIEIDALCSRAQERIDSERREPTGVDIVDMVMNDAVEREPVRSFERPRAGRSNAASSAAWSVTNPLRSSLRQRAHRRATFSNGSTAGRSRDFTASARALRKARRHLMEMYDDEADVLRSPSRHSPEYFLYVQKSRAHAERRYVGALIKYGRDTHRMRSELAMELQHIFTKAKMAGQGPVYRGYLLGLYPQELN